MPLFHNKKNVGACAVKIRFEPKKPAFQQPSTGNFQGSSNTNPRRSPPYSSKFNSVNTDLYQTGEFGQPSDGVRSGQNQMHSGSRGLRALDSVGLSPSRYGGGLAEDPRAEELLRTSQIQEDIM